MGQGNLKPINVKVQAISECSVHTKKQPMRFLSIVSLLKKVCLTFADIAEPLINLLSKCFKTFWT